MENCHYIIAFLIVIILILYFRREGFSSKESAGDIYKNTKSMFNNGSSYKKYKDLVPGADIVDYYKVKNLHDEGRFTEENIRDVLA